MKNGAYVASGETPIVLCSYGTTPGKAMKKLARLIDKYVGDNEDCVVLGFNSHYDEDGTFCMNATISLWN